MPADAPTTPVANGAAGERAQRRDTPASAPWRVRAVVPCYNRQRDLDLLLADLAAQRRDLRVGRVELSVTVVDNASDPPLRVHPVDVPVELLRLGQNRGGSGGFNAGMARALAEGSPGDPRELIWLLDSDARLEPGALAALVQALAADEWLAAVGSALVDPETGRIFEVGGRVDGRTGELVQPLPAAVMDPALAAEDDHGAPRVVRAEYVAACSLLARRSAVEAAGLMPDVFLNGDDAAWCQRLARATGLEIGAAPSSRAIHPKPDRMRTGARYYAARNAFEYLEGAGLGVRARLARALREVGRAVSMAMLGRDDLAELHVRGLEDAAQGKRRGPAEGGIRFEPFWPWSRLADAVREATEGQSARRTSALRARIGEDVGLNADEIVAHLREAGAEAVIAADERASVAGALLGLVRRPRWDVAVVSARGRVGDWLAGRVVVTGAPEGFVVRRISRRERAAALVRLVVRGGVVALRLGLVGPGGESPRVATPERAGAADARTPLPALSIVVVSYNRREAVERTLRELGSEGSATAAAQVILVDNGSTDGTCDAVRAAFPSVEVVETGTNGGVAAFNEGVRRARGEVVLVLDDDAWPGAGAVEGALDLLARRPDIAAVALHPRHARTGESEWPFGERLDGARDDWPVMGCGNLVRRADWLRAGGYEEAFFLYRNDTDLALKLLGLGRGVWFDPSWVVHHDSAAAARKSLRWFELATRNWIWMCRRHGRGLWGAGALLAGWCWAHRLAGLRPRSHWAVLRGAWAGLARKAPDAVAAGRRTGEGVRRLVGLRFGARRRA